MHRVMTGWRRIGVVFAIGMLVTLVAACGGKVREVTWDDNGRRLETAVGQTVVIKLESDPSSGNTWIIEAIDAEALKPVTVGAFKPGEDGGAGVQEFTFEAAIGRDVNLRIAYKPADDPSAVAEKTFAVEVAIR